MYLVVRFIKQQNAVKVNICLPFNLWLFIIIYSLLITFDKLLKITLQFQKFLNHSQQLRLVQK